jgi:hypothetical protein
MNAVTGGGAVFFSLKGQQLSHPHFRIPCREVISLAKHPSSHRQSSGKGHLIDTAAVADS